MVPPHMAAEPPQSPPSPPGLPSTAVSILGGDRGDSWPSELHSRMIKVHSFNEEGPWRGFLSVGAPFTCLLLWQIQRGLAWITLLPRLPPSPPRCNSHTQEQPSVPRYPPPRRLSAALHCLIWATPGDS